MKKFLAAVLVLVLVGGLGLIAIDTYVLGGAAQGGVGIQLPSGDLFILNFSVQANQKVIKPPPPPPAQATGDEPIRRLVPKTAT
jgi:hypothetical protein